MSWECRGLCVIPARRPTRRDDISSCLLASAHRQQVTTDHANHSCADCKSTTRDWMLHASIISLPLSSVSSRLCPRPTSTTSKRICAVNCKPFVIVGHSTVDIFFPWTSSLPTQDIPPTVKAKIWNLALTHTPDPNRSTAINFVDVNGKSLYIEDWRMVVVMEGGNVLHHAKRKGDCPGRGMSGGICPGGNVRTSVLYVS